MGNFLPLWSFLRALVGMCLDLGVLQKSPTDTNGLFFGAIIMITLNISAGTGCKFRQRLRQRIKLVVQISDGKLFLQGLCLEFG